MQCAWACPPDVCRAQAEKTPVQLHCSSCPRSRGWIVRGGHWHCHGQLAPCTRPRPGRRNGSGRPDSGRRRGQRVSGQRVSPYVWLARTSLRGGRAAAGAHPAGCRRVRSTSRAVTVPGIRGIGPAGGRLLQRLVSGVRVRVSRSHGSRLGSESAGHGPWPWTPAPIRVIPRPARRRVDA
jgi:hypothetical protein